MSKSSSIRVRMTRTSQTNKQQPSLFFDSWSEGHEIKDSQGRSQPLYHGTTHEFDEFDPKNPYANPENYFGKGFYFTNNKSDVQNNYAAIGPDLRSRIEQRAEELVNTLEYDADAYGEIDIYGDDGEPDQEKMDAWALAEAQKELVGTLGEKGKVMPAYLRMRNPVVVQPFGGTEFKFDEPSEENDFDDESGSAYKLYQAIQATAWEYGFDGQEVWNELSHLDFKNGVNAWQIRKSIAENEKLYDQLADTGKSAFDFISDVFKDLGHDGIDMDAWAALGKNMPHVKPNTRHYITWDPTAIKSSEENSGIYDPEKPKITAQNVAKSLVKIACALDREDPISAHIIDDVLIRLVARMA